MDWILEISRHRSPAVPPPASQSASRSGGEKANIYRDIDTIITNKILATRFLLSAPVSTHKSPSPRRPFSVPTVVLAAPTVSRTALYVRS